MRRWSSIRGAGLAQAVRLAGLGAAIALVGVGASGCAEEREPINRVQPNALPKAFYVGEDLVDTADDPSFYARAVITDVGYGAAQDGLFTSTYAQPVSVIKWEITEDVLIGRIVYNRVIGADSEGDGSSSIDGTVAYAFPILSHFDIRRDYNPTTGEESNVVVENTSDRPWNQREYFRVDWSRNLQTDAYDFDTLSLVGVYGGVSYEPLSYYVNDPRHPDAPHFATSEGYFDVTQKAFAVPGLVDLSHLGWGIDSFPACYLPNDIFGGSYPFGNCNPVEITLRMSFRRAEPSDYQPLDIDGNRFAAFGAFYGERFGYARNYGITDNQYYRLAARFNIWEWHHAYVDLGSEQAPQGCPAGFVESEKFPGKCEVPCYTSATPIGKEPTRDENGNGTDDECEAVTPFLGAGSRCDKLEQKCTLPYYKRQEKPLVWHYTKDSSPFYFEGSKLAAHDWDVAMRMAVQTAKYSDCIGIGAGQADCQALFPLYRGQQDDNDDAIALAREVDDCRAGIGAWAQEAGGAGPWEQARLDFCNAQADAIGAQRKYSAGVIAIAKLNEMVTLCHSPVEATDSPACVADHQRLMPEEERLRDTRQVLPAGITMEMCDQQFEARFDRPQDVDDELLRTCDNGFYARLGDLRYHQVNVLKNPQTPSPWGIMADADDPRTGEKINSSSNVWAHVNDLASQGLVDTLRYIAGEIPTEEITNGQYVRDWAQAANQASGKGVLGTMDRQTMAKRLAGAVDGRNIDNSEPLVDAQMIEDPRGLGATLEPKQVAAMKKIAKEKLRTVRAEAGTPSYNKPFTEARRVAAQGSDTEAALITEGMMQLAGMNGPEITQAGNELALGEVGTSPLLASASALRSLNPGLWRDMRQAREIGLANRGACILSADHIMAPAPNSLADLTKLVEKKFGKFNASDDKKVQLERAERIRKYLATKFQYAVMAHEMGHSIALRHNFVSSSFSYAYRPQYWQLRTKDGMVTEKCADLSETGEECIGPRYFDPPTDEEREGLIWMFSQSTVMDYPGELTQDLIGLGIYDFAAARFFYGDVMSVYNEPGYSINDTNRSKTLLNVTGNFGGILGWDWIDKNANTIHYTEIQEKLNIIKPDTCAEVDPNAFKPKTWDSAKDGEFDPLLDALIVKVNGRTTRCKQPEVDYVQYDQMRVATPEEAEGASWYDSIPKAVDSRTGRLRAPYGFATDGWADLGNLAVYRHDNGADAYELFNFLITEQEIRHIFDNYRRSRTTFSVRTQSQRILGRYNEKMRDGGKGLGLIANIFRYLLPELGENYDRNWGLYANWFYRDNILASGIAFDHFTRQFARPQSGPHTFAGNGANDLARPVLRAHDGFFTGSPPAANSIMYDGATGYFGNIAIGAKLVENKLGTGEGEFDRDYTANAGSYYDKVFAPYLLTESVDNFISDSLTDFTDPRYRSVSMADVFPDGYRRFLANQLTNDDYIKGPRIASSGGQPLVDSDLYPTQGIGWVTWWTPEPEVCWPGQDQLICSVYGCAPGNVCEVDDDGNIIPHALNPMAPAEMVAVDPQVKFEEHKWLIAQTLLYLPENAKTNWINLMGVWELGADNDPQFANRIELHIPDGRVYIARTYGTEQIFGKTVQRGVGARILEYANELMFKAYECTPVTSPESGATWCQPTIVDGKPVILHDPNLGSTTTCNGANNSGCTCAANRACLELSDYEAIPAFMRQAMRDFRMADASMKGIYD